MDSQYWWLIAGILLLLLEIFTPSFFAASLSIGTFGAAIAAYLGASLEVQLLLFSILSVLSVFILRPIIKKRMYASHELKTNADALIGKTGTVIESVNPDTNRGRCAIDGDEWQFLLADESTKAGTGDKVQVVKRDSIILTVKLLNH